ncbi:hypothetical protein [Methylocystis parvus]|uniref:Uncharacterized protein n=1 Tax=Methylocystis parvus TaxID=134 RepID=A0A6B8M3Y0_9HYPH|nr:hypothetical protein [Methylocystis parvus]QGM96802.1 hypothetical protein F7D14_04480 [Methylocystis parvus]WBJ99320.1 hypothetical protein MMG94_15145 [Methylocystis parvus OBBP]
MKSVSRFSAGLFAAIAPFGAQADPGLHHHARLAEQAPPLLSLHPAVGLLLVVAIWAASVRALEQLSSRSARF